MENRYLFRGKRIDNGEWVEGYLSYPFLHEKGNESYYFYAKDSLGFFCRCVVDASTICQCTGLKDKNSKLIWENDIVKYRVYQRTEQLYKVIYDYEEGSWSLGCNSEPLYSIGGANSEKCEVVGNAFDNPELLEV